MKKLLTTPPFISTFADTSDANGTGESTQDGSTTATAAAASAASPDANTAAGDPPADDVDTDGDTSQTETDWKKHARQWEKVAKQNKAAADKLAQLEDAQKTELQKAIERAEKAESRAKEAESNIARARIAAQHNVPAELLHGSTPEELEAAATALATWAKGKPLGDTIVGDVTGAGGAKDIKKQTGVNVGRERFKARKK